MMKRKDLIRLLKTEISALNTRLDSHNALVVALKEQLKAQENQTGDERRSQIFRRAAIDIVPDESPREFSNLAPVVAKDMGDAMVALGSRLDHKFAEISALREITERVNAGVFFDEVLDHVFENFMTLIPYDRIGVALIERGKSGNVLVRAQWFRAKYEPVLLGKGYAAVLKDSSLETIAETREPRIINDLQAYLESHPKSHSTQLMIREGVQSSLTCPLVAKDKVIEFIFFSSREKDAYRDQHIDLFSQVAGELALTLEKSSAYEDLYLRNEFIKKVFGQYVTNEVAEAVLSSDGPLTLGGERRRVTVLMADLRGFTPMSERLSPEEVVDTLNVFLGSMTHIVMKYGGSIDNFIGDALMAVFGVPLGKPDDTARAVACAVEMQNAIGAVNEEINGRNLPTLTMGIGLSSGEVVAGNIGSEMRVKYSVIGSVVNLGARIEGMASGGQIFASDATFNDVRDIVRTAGSLNVQLKGLPRPVPIHEITGIGGKYDMDKIAVKKEPG
ncbi:MAG: GAF domain-containing protein [Rhodospirillales bacterium]|nr:GAF domain-containing protein [Rhodospirillales bacterium]